MNMTPASKIYMYELERNLRRDLEASFRDFDGLVADDLHRRLGDQGAKRQRTLTLVKKLGDLLFANSRMLNKLRNWRVV